MALEVEIEGMEVLTARLRELGATGMRIAGLALHTEAETIMSESKSRYVPVDTGVLRASGIVLQPASDREGVEVRMGYGGAAEDYALIQHERLDYKHSVGGPKYLERPLLEAAKGMTERLARAFKGWQ